MGQRWQVETKRMWRSGAALALLLCGLCAPAAANTTDVPPAAPTLGEPAVPSESLPLPQPEPQQQQPQQQQPQQQSQPQPPEPADTMRASSQPDAAAPLRIALLLPLRSEPFGRAAEAVRDGFMAASQRDPAAASVTVFETGDGAQETLSGYAEAAASSDIVVGPLSRNDVTAIALSRAVAKPTLALAQPDISVESEGGLPRQLLVVALSIEDEARQVASWAATDKKNAHAFVVSTATLWQRRAAKAFSQQWKLLHGEAQNMELSSSAGGVSASSLVMLKKRLQNEKPALVFLALDAEQARQVRSAIGDEVALYGTSQLNPNVPQNHESSERANEMDGVRLLDMPWQIQTEHPAVMIYPRAEVATDQRRSPDLERLYALGIDAFRIAREIGAHHTKFELDGVTGKLQVGFGAGPARFKRALLPAIYQDGLVVPLPSNTSAP